jgi:hypothetical protein
MTATEDATSPNFGFLAKRYPELERIAARSERYFSDDPIVSLITLRQFGEALAQLVAARSGLYTNPKERQRDLLRRLRVDGRYPSNVLGLFDQLRKDGNAAAHHHTGDHAKALECLKMARKLGIWFYRTFDNHNFRPRPFQPPFQPPRPPIDATTELTAELDRSRAQRDAALSARTGRMSFSRKYAFVLALALAVAVIYAFAPLTRDEIAKLRWLGDINVIISKVLSPANREVRVVSVDPVAAANVDEDLDYRIAQRVKSMEGWRSFLAVHPAGSRAQSARAELDKLVGAQTPPAPELVQASNYGSPEMKTPSEAASPSQSPPGSEVATPTTDEVCRRDEDRLERLSNSRSSDEAMRVVTELRCEKLRPQLFRLTERLDYPDPISAAVATQDPSSTVATQNPSSRVVQAKVTSGIALARVARWGASEPQNRARWSITSHSPQQRRRANGWTGSSLPPIFLALFGEQPRNSTTFRRTRAWGGVGTGSGGVGATSGATGGVASAAGSGGGSGSGGSGSGGGPGGGGNGGGNGGGTGGGNGVEMAAATGVGTVGGAAAGIEVMFPRGHDFAAQDSILTRPFA